MRAELVTKTAYARLRGCDEKAVRKAVSEGRITAIEVDGRVMIDPAVADIQWARNTRARADSGWRGGRPGPDARPPPSAVPDAAADGADYWDSRGRREKAEATLAELRVAEQCGDLVRAADVRAAVSKRAAALRESFLQLPARVVPILAADPLPASMDRILRAEIVAALAQFTEAD